MAHDYAKKPRATNRTSNRPNARPSARTAPRASRSRKAPEPPQKTIPGWMWLLVGTAVGAFIMFLVRLSEVKPHAPAPAVKTAPPAPKASVVKPAPVAKKPVAAPKVVELPQPVQAEPAQVTPAAKAPEPTTEEPKAQEPEPQKPRFDFYQMLKENEVPVVTTNNGSAEPTQPVIPRIFILQVASYKKPEDAEQLKVELILLNLVAKTEAVNVRNGETWYRVLVGPFESRSELAKARSTLVSNGHQALVMEFKGK